MGFRWKRYLPLRVPVIYSTALFSSVFGPFPIRWRTRGSSVSTSLMPSLSKPLLSHLHLRRLRRILEPTKASEGRSSQDEVVRVLTNPVKTGSCLPHALLWSHSTGKTTITLAIAHQLFGVLELNASDDRGINVVRTKIKDFAAVAVGTNQRKNGYPCPPFKIIVLDEADLMTKDAQNALRHMMETYSEVTRLFFICNYISRRFAGDCRGWFDTRIVMEDGAA